MNRSELEALREGWDFEAKRAAGIDGRGALPQDFWPTYSAMANTRGGQIVLGVKERKDGALSVTGIEDIDRVEKLLWDQLQKLQQWGLLEHVGRGPGCKHELPRSASSAHRLQNSTRSSVQSTHDAASSAHRFQSSTRSSVQSTHDAASSPHCAPSSTHSAPSLPHSAPSSPHSAPSSPHSAPSSPHSAPSSPHSAPSSPHSAPSSPHGASTPAASAGGARRDEPPWPAVVREFRDSHRAATETVERALMTVCEGAYRTLQELSDLLGRTGRTLRERCITRLVRQGRLQLRYPAALNHPRQAYRAAPTYAHEGGRPS